MKGKAVLAALVTGLAIMVGNLVGVPAAHAGGAGHANEGAVARRCPSIICAVSFVVTNPGGAWLPFDCWVDSPNWPYGRWFRMTGNVAYLRAGDITSQPSLPRC